MHQSNSMLAFQAYLTSPKTRKVLSRRPGDQGFSLIELVVVVAVLAILAAIAIPAFTSINDKAAVSAAQNTLVQIVKECAVKKANGET
jgi:type IV pilus assembly protein PilA